MNTTRTDKTPVDELQVRRQLSAQLAHLPKAIEPPRDLWQGIASRLSRPAPKTRHPLLEISVAACVAALVSSVMFLSVGRQDAAAPAPIVAYQQLDAAYSPLRQVSLARYNANAAQMDPQLRQIVEKNLAIIDNAMAEIRQALKHRPNDPALNQLLQQTYQQQLSVLAAVAPAHTI